MPAPHDVTVIGAGPAGSFLAYLLAKKGIRVRILEKRKLPRYKPCGGGLTRRTLALLPFDLGTAIDRYAEQALIFHHGRLIFQSSGNRPILAMVRREAFDHFLSIKAVEAGADLWDGLAVRGVSGDAGRQTVHTSRESFQTRLVAGADGVTGPTARFLTLRVKRSVLNALEVEVHCDEPETLERIQGSAHFDFGPAPHGYAWVFPKKNQLSTGLLSSSPSVKHLRPLHEAYLQQKGLNRSIRIISARAHLIPYGPARGSVWANERGLLLGDAAGFTDPITGEGVYFALKEALLAADVIERSLERGYRVMNTYNRIIRRTLGRDSWAGLRLHALLYHHPEWSQRVLEAHGDGLGAFMMDVFNGSASYSEIWKRVLNPRRIFSLRRMRT